MKPLSAPAASQIAQWVNDAVAATPVYDLHTHLYPASFGPLMLWGVDELVTYHYLVAEVYRVVPASLLPYERFWAMSVQQRADHIWRVLTSAPDTERCS